MDGSNKGRSYRLKLAEYFLNTTRLVFWLLDRFEEIKKISFVCLTGHWATIYALNLIKFLWQDISNWIFEFCLLLNHMTGLNFHQYVRNRWNYCCENLTSEIFLIISICFRFVFHKFLSIFMFDSYFLWYFVWIVWFLFFHHVQILFQATVDWQQW